MAKPQIVFVVGTRPDAIKSAPVVLEFQKFANRVETVLVSTGQHREMLAQAMSAFGLAPDIDLDIMQHGQSLAQITTRSLEGMDRFLSEREPSFVMAQGDTTTTFVASLAAFYRHIPFGHIEAGLRTPSVQEPFPEEFNRRATSLIAAEHYAPTQWAAENLLREGVPCAQVCVTGNTGIDAVRFVAEHQKQNWYPDWSGRIVLLTTHRRENWGAPQIQIANAAKRIVEAFPDIKLVVPMHKNPNVRALLMSELGECPRTDLIEPPEYAEFVKLMQRSTLILTDSGGVQEEAPTFSVPVIVLRETTERPEGINSGAAVLVGTDQEKIFKEVSARLRNASSTSEKIQNNSPYGDGNAAKRIRYRVLKLLGIESNEEPMWT